MNSVYGSNQITAPPICFTDSEKSEPLLFREELRTNLENEQVIFFVSATVQVPNPCSVILGFSCYRGKNPCSWVSSFSVLGFLFLI